MSTIHSVEVSDRRFPLHDGAGADAVHRNPIYAYATTLLQTDDGLIGTGLAFTLGHGNGVVCKVIEALATRLVGREIEDLMANFAVEFRRLADEEYYRWLGPHKGVVHLALASIVNACFDLWAKKRGVPLWKLLLELEPEALLATVDLSYLEDALTYPEALQLLHAERRSRHEREAVLTEGYPGYDTSVGWFNYDDRAIRENAQRALELGFSAMKLKVGSADPERDMRRAFSIREVVGPNVRVMLDVNQQWTLPVALRMGLRLSQMNPYWIEEPIHPDDILGHQTLTRAIHPLAVAMGEHVPNRVVFKNYMQAQAAQFIQVDCVRVGGVSEFIAISLMAKKFGLKLVPHVGDMGQIHQHLVLFNHVGLGLEKIFLEYIPHLREYFVHPACVEGGIYKTPQEPGGSADLLPERR